MKRIAYLALLLTLAFSAACQSSPPTTTTTTDTSPAVEQSRPTPTTDAQAAAVEAYPPPAAQAAVVADGYPAPAAPAVAADSYPAPAGDTADEEVTSSTTSRTFILVPEQSEASYVVAETFLENASSQLNIPAGLVDTIGRTQVLEGEFVLDLSQANPLISSFFQVDLSTLSSDQSMRDNRLKRDWLESATYPLATFVATGIENFPADYADGQEVSFQLLGDLTIRNTTLPATFDVTATLVNGQIVGTAVAPLTMSNFGVDPPSMLGLFNVEDDFRVEISFTAEEQ
jgi:polyisoprenoid-binding protein YceI